MKKGFLALFLAMTLIICSGISVIAEPIQKAGTVDRVYGFKEGLARFEDKGKWGYMDISGNVVIEPQFDLAYDFQEGKALAIIDGKYYTVDKKGNVPAYKDESGTYPIDYFDGDIARIFKGDKTAFYNMKSGKLITDFIYTSRDTNIYKDFTIASIESKFGVLDANGNYIIEPKYEQIYVKGEFGSLGTNNNYIAWNYDNLPEYYKEQMKGTVKDYYFVVRYNGKYGVANNSGKQVIDTQYDAVEIMPGYIMLKKNNKYSVYNTAENKMLVGIYDQIIGNFNLKRDGILGVKVNGMNGVIDGQGTFVIQPSAKAQGFYYLPDANIKVQILENNALKYQIVDKKGKIVVPVLSNEFELVYNTDAAGNNIKDDYLYITRSEYKYGLMDKNFKQIITPTYREIGKFCNGIAKVGVDGSNGFTYGFINKSGKVIYKPVLLGAYDFIEGMAVVTIAGKNGLGIGGYMTSSGKLIGLSGTTSAEDFTGNYAPVYYNDNTVGIIDKSGAFISKGKFGHVRYNKGDDYFRGELPLNDNSIYSRTTAWTLGYFYNLKGKKLIDKGYVRTIEYKYPTKAFVGITNDHKMDFIDSNFKIIKSISYPTDIDIFSYLQYSPDEGYLKYATRNNGKIVEVLVDVKGNEIARGRRTYDIYLSPTGSICYDEHVGFIKESKLPRRKPGSTQKEDVALFNSILLTGRSKFEQEIRKMDYSGYEAYYMVRGLGLERDEQSNPVVKAMLWTAPGHTSGNEIDKTVNLTAEIIRYYSKSDADAMLLFEFLDDKFKNGSKGDYQNITAPIELGKVFTFGGTKVRFERNTIGLGGADKVGVFIHFVE